MWRACDGRRPWATAKTMTAILFKWWDKLSACVRREKRNEKEGRDKKQKKKVRSKRTGVKTTIICCRWKGNCLVVSGGGATIGRGGRKDVAAAAATCHPDQRTVTPLLRLLPERTGRASSIERERVCVWVRQRGADPWKGQNASHMCEYSRFPPQKSILLYYYFIVVETRQWRPHIFLTCRKKRIFLFVARHITSAVCLSSFHPSKFHNYTWRFFCPLLFSRNTLENIRNLRKNKYFWTVVLYIYLI